MRLFGHNIKIEKILPEPKPLTELEQMAHATDMLTNAWAEYRERVGGKVRPWIVWADKEVVLIEGFGDAKVVYPPQ